MRCSARDYRRPHFSKLVKLQLDRMADCERLCGMHRFLLSLITLALVVPFGVFESAEAACGEMQHDRWQCCADESSPASEGEVEDSELYFHGVPFFEHHVRADGRLPLLQGNFVVAADIDPQGCRPPPAS